MATSLPRSLMLLRAEHSLLPFLYQTRTITASPFYLRRKTIQPRRCRPYSTDKLPSDEATSDGAPSKVPIIPESSGQNAISESDSASGDATARPKNYLRKRAARAAAAAAAAPSKSASSTTPSSKSHSTMTYREKKVFDRLFQKFGTGLPSQQQGKTEPAKEQPKKSKARGQRFGDSEKLELSEISEVFNEVIQEVKLKNGESAADEALTPEEFARLKSYPKLHRYVPNLDIEVERVAKMIERIRRFKYSDVDVSERAEEITIERVVELVARRESEKIETALQAAIDEGKGDIGIWEVCEERVFGMLRHLGENDVSKPDTGFHGRQGPVGKDTAGSWENLPKDRAAVDSPDESSKPPIHKSATQPPTGPLDIPPFVPVYPVISTLYPKMLLATFRLLENHFPNSPLIGQLLPTIKSHGRTSIILGASTKLYNGLILYYWRVYDDLSAIVSLLEEMDTTGVDPNVMTSNLIQKIIRQRAKEKKEHRMRMRQQDDRRGRPVGSGALFETEPNQRALKKLVGSAQRPGWAHHLKARLQEISERRRVEREDLEAPIHRVGFGEEETHGTEGRKDPESVSEHGETKKAEKV